MPDFAFELISKAVILFIFNGGIQGRQSFLGLIAAFCDQKHLFIRIALHAIQPGGRKL